MLLSKQSNLNLNKNQLQADSGKLQAVRDFMPLLISSSSFPGDYNLCCQSNLTSICEYPTEQKYAQLMDPDPFRDY